MQKTARLNLGQKTCSNTLNKNLLNTGIQNFISKNLETDTLSVLLSNPSFKGASTKEVVQQIEAAKKCKKKLPKWFYTQGIYYPLPLQIEQTSSETTAAYKAGLCPGKSLVDLSGGTGVDSFYFAKHNESVSHVEIDSILSEIVAHNFKVLGVSNIRCVAQDATDFLMNNDRFETIYLDPSRRDHLKGKVFKLADCSPNVPALLDTLWTKTDHILIKTSPLLDIRAGLEELNGVSEVQAVAVGNEVKELLWILKKGHSGPVTIKAVLLESTTTATEFETELSTEANSLSNFSNALEYLYEPHAAVLKLGAFKSLGVQLDLHKLHEHSHLYTATRLIDFPGRRFTIKKVLPYANKTMKDFAKSKANVSIRNFKLSVAALRKKHSLLDGGHVYLFFTTDLHNKAVVIVCEKIK